MKVGLVLVVMAALTVAYRTGLLARFSEPLSMTGTMAASVIGFSFARFVARDWISKRIPARFKKYDEALERNALRTVVILRILFWMPQALHAFLGVSKVRFSTHFWGSLIGYVPPLLLVSYFGADMFDASGHIQPKAYYVMGSLALATALYLGVSRLCRSPRLATGTSGS